MPKKRSTPLELEVFVANIRHDLKARSAQIEFHVQDMLDHISEGTLQMLWDEELEGMDNILYRLRLLMEKKYAYGVQDSHT